MTQAPRLLIRLGSLGDVVLATAAATAWKRRLGDAPLDVLVKEEWASLWEGHPAVRQVHGWSADERSAGGVVALARRLRGAEYAGAVDLQGTLRTRSLTTLAGIPVGDRPARFGSRRRSLVRFKRGGPPDGYSVLRSFVAAVDPESDALPSVHPSPEADARAGDLIGGAASPVALVPGARHATKRWPLERFAEVARGLHARGEGTVAVFGPDEHPLQAAWTALRVPGAAVVFGEPLPVVAAVLARCRRALTGDTGLMHLSAAVGTPVVALFGPTVRAFGFAPAGEGHRILERALDCRPCSVHGTSACPRGHFRCMLDLAPEAALDALPDA